VASITPYGDRWRAVVRRVGYKVRSKIHPTKRLAEAWARSIEREMDHRSYFDPGKGLKTTVGELFEKFSTDVCPHRKGGRWEAVRLAMLLRTADFVERRLDQLQPEDIRAWRDERLKEVSEASVNREMNLISGVFTHAIKEWGMPLRENPVYLVKRPSNTGRHRNRRWTEDDIAKVLRAAEWKQEHRPRVGREYVGWAVLVAIETAMRLGELCSLRVGDFHPAERYVTLHDTKNGDPRAVPLSKKAVELLTILVEGRGASEQIFGVSAASLGVYFRKVRKKAGVVDLRFHDTRHEAATRLSKKLPNVLELSAVTGHRSLQSLKRYYNPTATELASKLD
jgi:integrase